MKVWKFRMAPAWSCSGRVQADYSLTTDGEAEQPLTLISFQEGSLEADDAKSYPICSGF